MKLSRSTLALAAALAFASSAQAVVFAGTTAGGPTFNRPVSLASLSGVGTAVAYWSTLLSVTAAGSYTFNVTTVGAYDPFIALYTPSFNPASGLTSLVALNDDFPAGNFNQSQFSFALNTGTNYVFVITGFDNTDFGAFSASITGPGNVILGAIPEPSSYALLALGLIGTLAAARRRKQA